MKRIWQGWGEDWRYSGGMTRLQKLRHSALVNDGLTPVQAREFIWYSFSQAYMRRFRSNVRRGLAGTTKSSAWALWRKIYDEAIDKGKQGKRGGYLPPPRKYDPNKPHKKTLPTGEPDKEHHRMQNRGYRAKKKAEKSRTDGVFNIKYDTVGNIIGGVKQNPETGKFETWKP